jgi:hypothetical protein
VVELVEFVRITLPFTGTGGRTPDRRPMALESSQLVGPTSEARGYRQPARGSWIPDSPEGLPIGRGTPSPEGAAGPSWRTPRTACRCGARRGSSANWQTWSKVPQLREAPGPPLAATGSGGAADLVFPEPFEPHRRKLGIANGVLDVLVAEVGLQATRVDAFVGQLEAAGVPKHMRVNTKIELRCNA